MSRRQRLQGPTTGTAQPTWLMTFADLVTLLLTFFILLLSFSKMDVDKYRAIANAMSQAFGVAFVPSSTGLPDLATLAPTPDAGVIPSENVVASSPTAPLPQAAEAPVPAQADADAARIASEVAAFARHEDLATAMILALEDPIASGDVTVQYDAQEVLLRFSERSTFASGSEILQPDMSEVLRRVVDVLAPCSGEILVTGHSDDRPVGGGRFRSNWDLSAARAVSVVHELVLDGRIDARRVRAIGHAETHPLVPNDSVENRALNRRVEIHVQNADCDLDGL